MVAPRSKDQRVGGWYRMTAGEDDEGGDVEMSSPEYCSLSDRIVTPDSAMGFGASSEDMVLARPVQVGFGGGSPGVWRS